MTALARDLVQRGIESRIADLLGDTAQQLITAAGATLATATPLTASINHVTTVAAGANGVRLPRAETTPYSRVFIRNEDAVDTLTVYPDAADVINNLTPGVGITIAATQTRTFYKTSNNSWIST